MAIGSTYLVKDVLFRASNLLTDLLPTQFVRWTEKELVANLNDGQRAIAKYMPSACSRVDAVKLAPGTRQSLALIQPSGIVPSDGLLPANPVRGIQLLDIVRNMGSDGLTPGAAIRIVPREVMDNIDPLWHRTSAAAIDHYTFDPRTPVFFYVTPAVPITGAVWIEIVYAANPEEIPYSGIPTYGHAGSSTTTISIDDKFVDDLVNYIVARAFLKDSEVAGNVQSAQLYTQLFTASLNAQVEILTGQNPNLSFLPFAAGMSSAAR